jgi:hypothetical protein
LISPHHHTLGVVLVPVLQTHSRSVEHGTWPFLLLLGQRILTRLNK